MPRKVSRGKSLLTAAALLLALYGAGRLIGLGTDLLFYPWVRASPPITGEWVGRLTTGSGRPRAVYLTIDLATDQDGDRPCAKCSKLEGTGRMCDERGQERPYRIFGSPEDRRATRLHLGASPAVDPPPDGLELSSMRGRWDGGDALDLEAEFHWRRGVSAITSTADPDTKGWVPLPLRRGGEADFREVCRRIASR